MFIYRRLERVCKVYFYQYEQWFHSRRWPLKEMTADCIYCSQSYGHLNTCQRLLHADQKTAPQHLLALGMACHVR